MNYLDLNNWKRREHFDFFRGFDEPFFGIVTEIDCTAAYNSAKENKHSFFASYLHKSLFAANQVAEFRYRIDKDNVVIHDEIHASPTIGRDDDTFGFAFIPFHSDFEVFERALNTEIRNVKNSAGLRLNKESMRGDVIHYSSLPWSKFTGLTHARHFQTEDSAPKITFGKLFSTDDKQMMPVSVNAHHGLVDGIHVARFFELFQKQMDG